MLGLTMRIYKEVVQQFADAYGLEKSTTSEYFVKASRQKLKLLMERSTGGVDRYVGLGRNHRDGVFRSDGLKTYCCQVRKIRKVLEHVSVRVAHAAAS